MSRHHTLPPIIYTPPPPKPKSTRRRRGIGYAYGAGAAGETEDIGNGAHSAPIVPQHARPVETVERRVPSPNGKLSDDTLRAMLEVQEKQTG
ncbi:MULTISPECIES: hypothetical protein [Bradyrhizobium]|uniref:hypothetical protein n=1 Tax=Bradyrhizobium TaxID=374 RepID=UPI00067E9A8A|nr:MULTISPECIES: hypothetical protein [Bradyrhizobium]PAY10999.1 hypothetical protein CK489_02300 [Bradyrhizobium sp. UFLA03-84]